MVHYIGHGITLPAGNVSAAGRCVGILPRSFLAGRLGCLTSLTRRLVCSGGRLGRPRSLGCLILDGNSRLTFRTSAHDIGGTLCQRRCWKAGARKTRRLLLGRSRSTDNGEHLPSFYGTSRPFRQSD